MLKKILFASLSIAIGIASLGRAEAQELDIRRSRLGSRLGFVRLRDCPIFAGVSHVLVLPNKRANSAIEMASLIGEQLRVQTNDNSVRYPYRLNSRQKFRYFQCHKQDGVTVVTGRLTTREPQQIIAVSDANFPVRAINVTPTRRPSADTSALGRACNGKIVSIPGDIIYKTVGSRHFPSNDPRRWSVSLIRRKASSWRFPSCINILDKNGKTVGNMGIYSYSSHEWGPRSYGGWGCGKGTGGGSSVASAAMKSSRSNEVYFDMGDYCFGPQRADSCKNSKDPQC